MTLKIEAGKKYRTRGGHEAEVLRTDVRDEQPVVGIITFNDGGQSVTEWSVDGSFWPDGEGSTKDLISEIRPKRVVWLNVYDTGDFFIHETKQQADRAESPSCCRPSRIACIRVEFEENQFDD